MNHWMMPIALGVLLAAPTVAQGTPPAAGGVCSRLAPQLGLKPQDPARVAKGEAPWAASMFGVGAILFGGSAGVSFSVQPADDDEHASTRNFAKMCAQEKANIMCRVKGPAHIVIGSKKGEASADVAAGEYVEVGTKSKQIVCRDTPA